MKKKVKVHMLPTLDNTNLILDVKNNNLFYTTSKNIPLNYQHLYFTSDEKIEEGDWALYLECGTNDEPLKDTYPYLVEFPDESHWNDRRIMATTDKSLKIYESETLASASGFNLKTDDILLPQIPQSFIKQYVEAGGKIDEVEIGLDCYEDRQCVCGFLKYYYK